MDRERQVAIHEACHTTIAYWNGDRISKTEIWRTKENDTNSETTFLNGESGYGRSCLGYDHINPTRFKNEGNGSYWKKEMFYRNIMMDASGYIGQYMDTLSKEFYETNTFDPESNTDLKSIKNLVSTENITDFELRNLFKMVELYLALPTTWGFVNALANLLIEKRTVTGNQSESLAYKIHKPVKPKYDASEFIEFLVGKVYEK
jgi:hypothetical protein